MEVTIVNVRQIKMGEGEHVCVDLPEIIASVVCGSVTRCEAIIILHWMRYATHKSH